MKTINVTLRMRNYIAHPFWPAKNTCIEIEKKSGVNRLKVEEKRIAALKAECSRQGVTYEQYLQLQIEAKEEWYRRSDGTIYVPRHQLAGGLVQTIGSSPRSLNGPYNKDNFRALAQIGDFETDCKEASGVFSRFVKLEGSNQRSWQENEFLGQYLDEGEPFDASGVLQIVDPKQVDTLKRLFVHTIENIGIGAARKMGFGRGEVVAFEEV